MTVSSYYNYMGFFSQILLAVCDANVNLLPSTSDNIEVHMIVLF